MTLTKSDWVSSRGFPKEVKSDVVLCPHWLLGAEMTPLHRLSCLYAQPGRVHWFNNVSAWLIDDEPAILLAQPRELVDNDILDVGLVYRLGLQVSIHGDGFYGDGGSVAVEVTAL